MPRKLHCLEPWKNKGVVVTCLGRGQQCLQHCITVSEEYQKRAKFDQCVSDIRQCQPISDESTLKSNLLMCVERRLVYASGCGKAVAFNRDGPEILEILEHTSDISAGVIALSADIAAVLYPLFLTTSNLHRRMMMWRTISIKRVPAPLLLFLHQAYPNTDWNSVFFGSVRTEPKIDDAYLVRQKMRTRRKMGTTGRLDSVSASASSSDCVGGVLSSGAAVAASSGSMETCKEAVEPRKLSCYYKHYWIEHTGWMTSIAMRTGTPKYRFVCLGCLEKLQMDRVGFEMAPCVEETNQIYTDASEGEDFEGEFEQVIVDVSHLDLL